MASQHTYDPAELPAAHEPYGFAWMARRLTAVGYTNARAGFYGDYETAYLQVDEDGVSKNQLLNDVQPAEEKLTTSGTEVNVVPGGDTATVYVNGPADKLVVVKFSGVSFCPATSFAIPEDGRYPFQVGPCLGQARIVEPQQYTFVDETDGCSPAAFTVTFREWE